MQHNKRRNTAGPQHNHVVEHQLASQLTQLFDEEARQVEFTPELRRRILANLPPRRRQPFYSTRLFIGSLATAAVLVLALTIGLLNLPHTSAPTPSYTVASTLSAPATLANGGHLLSLDPTGQYLVYQPANQPGVLYTANISDPLNSEAKVMEDAVDAAWAPDGSALVATIVPAGGTQPLLALAPTGKYMHTLGPTASAASWLPTAKQQITYVTPTAQQTKLWTITPDASTSHNLATMDISLPVQHLAWSPDGQELALVVTTPATSAAEALNQPARGIYLMNAQNSAIEEIIKPGNFHIGAVQWSPRNHYLTYEQIDDNGQTTLHAYDIGNHKDIFTIAIKQTLNGWSWSPDGQALLYSDGGRLTIYTVQGHETHLPHLDASQVSPQYLKDGRILYLESNHGSTKLVILKPTSTV